MKLNQKCLAAAVGVLLGPLAIAQEPSPELTGIHREPAALSGLSVPSTASVMVESPPMGEPELVLQDGVTVPLTNPSVVQGFGESLELTVDLVPEPEFPEGRQAYTVTRVSLDVLDDWHATKENFPIDRFESLHEAYQGLEFEVSRLSSPVSPGTIYDDIGDRFEAVEEALADIAATEPRSLWEQVCSQFVEVRNQRLKSQYGRNDNYTPRVYQEIYENSRSVAALVPRGLNCPRASGVLIGRNLLLTCLHAVGPSGIASDWEVWFNFFLDEDGSPVPKDIFPVVEVLQKGARHTASGFDLDFALLKLGKNADGENAHEKYTIAHLRKARVRWDDAIYVIGYPEGNPLAVHDNAFVLFPYLVDEREWAKINMLVCAEIKDSMDRETEIQGFLADYTFPNPLGFRENHSKRWKSPVIGANCDTYHGNSGSPAFDRRMGGVIGILFAGQPDWSDAYRPGLRRHEAVLPITEVLGLLEGGLESWQQEYGIVVR